VPRPHPLRSALVAFTLAISAAVTAGPFASGASAAAQVWWTNAVNYGANPGLTAAVARADIDGSNMTAVIDKSTTSYVSGIAVDLWRGKMYYLRNNRALVSANLDGSNPQVILSGNDVAVNEAWDLVYDRKTDYLYWISEQYSTNGAEIRRVRPDGSSPSVLYTQAQVGNIRVYDITVVPELDRIYWGNYEPTGAPINYANLDGSGNIQGITPSCGGAATSNGLAIAVDPSTDRMFAVIAGGSPSGAFRVRKTKLDGSDCETLATVWSSINDDSMALNRAANQLIVGNYDTSRGPVGLWSISDSTPNQTPGSALIPDALPTAKSAANALIVEPPKPITTTATLSTSATTVGATLTLAPTQDAFAPDEPGVKVFRGVTSRTIAWYRNGVLIPGETGSTLTAAQPGTYKAVTSASNLAGGVETTSNEVTISAPPSPSSPKVSVLGVSVLRGETLRVVVRPSEAGTIRITGRLAGGAACSGTIRATSATRLVFTCRLSSTAQARIRQAGAVVRASARLTTSGGSTATDAGRARVSRYAPRPEPVTG